MEMTILGDISKCKRIYISGPITGVENWQENFNLAEQELLKIQGAFSVANPVTLSQNVEKQFARLDSAPSYADYMAYDIKVLCDCDSICMLPQERERNDRNPSQRCLRDSRFFVRFIRDFCKCVQTKPARNAIGRSSIHSSFWKNV